MQTFLINFFALSLCVIQTAMLLEPRSRTMKVSLLSRRNHTGHWTAQVKVQHNKDGAVRPSWDVDLEQTVTSEGGLETVNILATITAPPDVPGPGYDLYPGTGYYKFHTTPLIWRDALRTCTQEGAHLAIINSPTESSLIKNIYARYPTVENTIDNKFAFVGYHDFYEEGQFQTIFGQPLNKTGFNTFIPGNPNNAPVAGDPDQDCGGVSRAGLLNDLPCNSRYAFFCELELSE